MTRPSARPVPPGSARRTSTGHPTPGPCAKLLEERIALRLRHREHRVPVRDVSPYVTAGVPAAVPPAAGTPGRRSALPGARVALRRAAPPEPVEGLTSDLPVRAREPALTSRLEEMLVRRTGRDPGQVSGGIERDLVLHAWEAVEYGPVARVAPRGVTGGAPDAG
ncbi:ATP-dependent Clp protease proteolytic subunit [Streptomyces phaeoluteigriseus]|uniref:ATP-dependent Clp protease proteolytic subunit n=1 Tax=Streptomyces phaeoluteigriseus TaxID=114686 RepID=A0ABY4ZD52_9ACTN|nr:ATP-dependent Clp protease proteolytic subunit [Streptomyces phaeoluteigriseus]USQ86947.1 ATP-dependent Clp protease proteolytic subunit [Streptomyces phaeoluteigriseus]